MLPHLKALETVGDTINFLKTNFRRKSVRNSVRMNRIHGNKKDWNLND